MYYLEQQKNIYFRQTRQNNQMHTYYYKIITHMIEIRIPNHIENYI